MIWFLRLRGAINQHDMGPQLSPLEVTLAEGGLTVSLTSEKDPGSFRRKLAMGWRVSVC
jgi:hypothetical protein